MEVRLMAAVAADLDSVNVSELARTHGVSRKTIYKWRNRFRAQGLSGLEPQSRRPLRSPNQISLEVEEAAVALRKELIDEGLDGGPATVAWHLERRGFDAPSPATLWRLFVRRGFVTPEPRKRPKASYRRFAADSPNECWQIDASEWRLKRGRRVEIFSILDDCSRLLIACVAVPAATTEAAWDAFSLGVEHYGLPLRCLSDNGLAFSGRLRGMEVGFEANLRAAGVRPVTARPYHPQTCGKVERFHQTLKKWLRARRRSGTVAELQALLDGLGTYYNHERPHRALGKATPWERWCASPRALGDGGSIPTPALRSQVRVDGQGQVRALGWSIHVGVDYTGHRADVVVEGDYANVFIDGRLERHLRLDRSRSYQPSGRKRGPRPVSP